MSSVRCEMCPKTCWIKPGESGDCRVRKNLDGKLVSVVYGFICAANVDPVEKKPLFHYLPGTSIFSIATVGCNLHCLNCQNWEISQANPEDVESTPCSPEQVVELAKKNNCPSLAYTYTDPVVFYEYARDCSKIAHSKKIRNVLVTAAYINPKPWEKLLEVTDAANIDLKHMNDKHYQEICSATLEPVLESLKTAVKKIHLEVTNLVIPTINDSAESIRKLVKWHKENLGPQIPLHFSRFYPKYKMKNLPPTPAHTLETARRIAIEEGLNFVYIGNLMSKDGQNTFCPRCGKVLIERSGYSVIKNNLLNGKCPCGEKIYGVWS